jgi:endonuclease/exonuclease/phosphatase family metal-dependent hydrolase
MQLVTWNVHSFRDARGRYVGPRVVEALAESPATVLALQEIDSLERPGTARLPLEALSTAFPYQRVTYTIENHWRRYGHALLSRVPLHADRAHDVRCRGFELRRLLDAEIDTRMDAGADTATGDAGGGRRLRLIAAHLDLAPWARYAQLRQIAAVAASGALPTLVLGDLNAWTARAIRRRVGPALELVSSPPTFPAARPWLSLDRALCRPPGLVRRVSIAPLPRDLSDHLPLLVEV